MVWFGKQNTQRDEQQVGALPEEEVSQKVEQFVTENPLSVYLINGYVHWLSLAKYFLLTNLTETETLRRAQFAERMRTVDRRGSFLYVVCICIILTQTDVLI
jgi:hypothetical protein